MNAQRSNRALRVLTVTLGILLLGLSVYTIKFYNEVKDNEKALVEEKSVVEGELRDIIAKYNEEIAENNDLKAELVQARSRIETLLDSLEQTRASQALLEGYRAEIRSLRRERESFITLTRKLKAENEKLAQQQNSALQMIDRSQSIQDSLRMQNDSLQSSLAQGALLTVSNLRPQAVLERNSGKLITTARARRADKLNVCFSVDRNTLAAPGTRNFYIQVIDPKNNVQGDRAEVAFDEQILRYSTLIALDYANEAQTVCSRIAPSGEQFVEGIYRVLIFENARLLASEVINLK
ncbi:hypothetical protein [Croceiramulus getboli]|nr:hypothetical protein P8624_05965 [Flavobacteriaceae bacterium YJPT1-3]